MESAKILIADDDRKTRDFVTALLTYKGHTVIQATDGKDALEKAAQNSVHLVITDLMMPRINGLEFVKRLKALQPDVVTIAYSAYGNYEMTQELLKAGVFFYLDKPFKLEELDTLVSRGLEHRTLLTQKLGAMPRAINRNLLAHIVGEHTKMLSLFELIEKVAGSDATVLIQGESGTGKELVAKAIHDLSSRSAKSFVAVNCGAIPDDLLESELFGHVKGSFTGAVATRIGRFEMADRGTLFLDEIGEMKPNMQVKLLRVLQTQELDPVGSTRTKKIDVRIIAATNKNLEQLVENKGFREDLYYRLSVIPVTLPPLRERKSDIPLLILNFLDRINKTKHGTVTKFDESALKAIQKYDWPGNVRELENLVERLVVLKEYGVITAEDLPEKYRGTAQTSTIAAPFQLPEEGICLNSVIEDLENRLIQQALKKTGGNKKEAAQLLNLKRTTLIEKLKKKNLAPPDDPATTA